MLRSSRRRVKILLLSILGSVLLLASLVPDERDEPEGAVRVSGPVALRCSGHPAVQKSDGVAWNISEARLDQKQLLPRYEGTFSETYLVFYGKPSMQSLWNVGSSRGWKMKHIITKELSELQELVSPDRFLVVYTHSGAFQHKLIRQLANSTNALVGTIGNAFKATGSKKTEIISFRNYFQSFGCSLEDTSFMPKSFVLDDPNECVQFFRYLGKQPNSMWLLKPSHGHSGAGMTMHSNLTFFYKEYATCMKKPNSIVQEYVSDPLLVEERKFDFRTFILIAQTSPYYLVFYHEGYVRRAIKKYDVHGSREVHLTNTDV